MKSTSSFCFFTESKVKSYDCPDIRVLEITRHLNIGQELIDSEKEKFDLARLNIISGHKAKSSTAFQPAAKFFNQALKLLPDNLQKRDYKLWLELYLNIAETEYLSGNIEKADLIIDKAINESRSIIDIAKLYNIKLVAYTGLSEYEKAVQIGITALKLFKIRLSIKPSHFPIIVEIIKTKMLLKSKNIEDIINMKMLEEEEQKIIFQLFADTATPIYLSGNSNLFALIVLKWTVFSLKHGYTSGTSHVFNAYAILLIGVLKDYETAYAFGDLAIKINEKLNSTNYKCKVYFLAAYAIQHWKNHIRTIIPLFNTAFSYGIQTGDLIYAGYAINNIIWAKIYSGFTLDEIIDQSNKAIAHLEQTKDYDILRAARIGKQFCLCLSQNLSSFSFNSERFKEEEYIKTGAPFSITLLLIAKTQLLLIFGQYDEGLRVAFKVSKLLDNIMAMYPIVDHSFHFSLLLALNPQKKKYKKLLLQNQKQMKKWADLCAENCLHKYLLISAEIARIEKKQAQAISFYNKAIQSAKENKFLHNEALSNELAAKFFISQNQNNSASIYIKEAHYLYKLWGALAKVNDLQNKYPDLV